MPASGNEGQIAAIAATAGAALAKLADYLLSRRKGDTDHEDTLIKALMDEAKQLRLEMKEEREECHRRTDAMQETMNRLMTEGAELRARVASLEKGQRR